MFRLRLTTDAQPRVKNGHPPQSTTGVAKASCTRVEARPGRGVQPNTSPPIVSANSGIERATLTQKRRVMSASSGFGPSSRLGATGSNAMPQIGQLPGPRRRTCGCMGQVHIEPSAASTVWALPSCGWSSPFWRTSFIGCSY